MRKFFIRFFLGLLSLVVLLAVTGILFINFAPAFGGDPSEESLKRFREFKYFNGEHFENLVETSVMTSDPEESTSIVKMIIDFFNPPKGKNPEEPLPSEKFDPAYFKNGDFVWLGHSTILMRLSDLTIMTDPVFFGASPIPGTAEPFDMQQTTRISDLPAIDAVLISHDHYDHLDYKAIVKLKDKVDQFYVPLGVKAHLTSWGVDESKIVEMEWYENTEYKGLQLVMTPSRHFSGRGLTDRFSTLWSSWVIQSPSDSINVFFSGDSGYFEEFKKIGDTYGPFDIAFMENGAYDADWSQIHFMPGENVEAAIDLQAKHMFAIHWGKFDLARHPWDEPIILADSIAEKRSIPLITPMIGEIFNLKNPPTRKWWLAMR